MDGPTDWKGMLPNHWVPQDPRVPSIKLAHVMDDVFELVSGGASSADVIPGYEDSPDLYPVWSPTELRYWANVHPGWILSRSLARGIFFNYALYSLFHRLGTTATLSKAL